MNDSDISDLARMLPVPDARDFQAGRQQTLKEHLMTEFRIAGDHRAGLSPARRTRLRPRILGAATATAATAAVAVAVGVTLPASHPASRPPAQLAAWTVTRQAGGIIHVSFFGELRDPAALQRTLRADGVPASVTFIGQQNPACHSVNYGGRPPIPGAGRAPGSGSGPGSGNGTWLAANGLGDALAIRPSELPPGDGVQIAVWPHPKGSGYRSRAFPRTRQGQPVAEVGLVKASPQCTGN